MKKQKLTRKTFYDAMDYYLDWIKEERGKTEEEALSLLYDVIYSEYIHEEITSEIIQIIDKDK